MFLCRLRRLTSLAVISGKILSGHSGSPASASASFSAAALEAYRLPTNALVPSPRNLLDRAELTKGEREAVGRRIRVAADDRGKLAAIEEESRATRRADAADIMTGLLLQDGDWARSLEEPSTSKPFDLIKVEFFQLRGKSWPGSLSPVFLIPIIGAKSDSGQIRSAGDSMEIPEDV